MIYPHVFDEWQTIEKVIEGYNLARFGDGELKMCFGQGYVRQVGSEKLAEEIKGILRKPSARCLVGIPTMDEKGPKYQSWLRHQDRFLRVLASDIPYYSAFVSRPDSAPWISTKAYGQLVQRIWLDRRAVVLCEPGGSMLRAVKRGAGETVHVPCPTHQAYDRIDELEAQILAARPEIVVLSCGPTATCLADRLAVRGVHAVDLGSAGQFILRMLA